MVSNITETERVTTTDRRDWGLLGATLAVGIVIGFLGGLLVDRPKEPPPRPPVQYVPPSAEPGRT